MTDRPKPLRTRPHPTPLKLDGAQGEGGGQILRTSLALSMLTHTPIELRNIRAGRAKPGLLRQHLAAVMAAKQVGCAHVEGAELGSQTLTFSPSVMVGGHYQFSVGSAGSATLVLQTILPALLHVEQSSTVLLEGGTHNNAAPPFDFLAHSFLPVLNRMGANVQVTLERHGFFPVGGGKLQVQITPGEFRAGPVVPTPLKPLHLPDRGAPTSRKALALVNNLPANIGQRELGVLIKALQLKRQEAQAEDPGALGPGNVLMLFLGFEQVTEVITAFGERGKSSEQVAEEVLLQANEYLSSDAPVGEHLADQLLLPLALAGTGSFRTVTPSLHTRTNIDVIRQFLDIPIRLEQEKETVWRVEMG